MKDGLKFNVIFLEEAKEFLDHLDSKARAKIIYNINKASITSDIELFKKLQGDIWEFRTMYSSFYYRLFAFWDKSDNKNTMVISTHGIIKKEDKISKKKIERAERLRDVYFNSLDSTNKCNSI
ncbi:type II toxin-antitoxin system RelE/ParE family toxin [Myroides odoratimimus]|uniref:type II toxin-antitoxin system RelE/ParE family toxin n=1 Tax=Myroides odoratimimus TaxID=76832 RepID=UPI003D2F817A